MEVKFQPYWTCIIQESALGPVSYVVNAGDLTTVTPGNQIHKYADDIHIFLYLPVTFIHVKLKLTMSLTGHRLII